MAKNDNCSSGAYKERKSSLRHVILPNTERGHRLSIVKSPFTGRYVLAKEFSPVEKEFAEKSASLGIVILSVGSIFKPDSSEVVSPAMVISLSMEV